MPSRSITTYKKFTCEKCGHIEPFAIETKVLYDVDGSKTERNVEETEEYLIYTKEKCKCGGDFKFKKPVYNGICGYDARLCDYNADGTPGPLHWKSNTSFRDAAKVYMDIRPPF